MAKYYHYTFVCGKCTEDVSEYMREDKFSDGMSCEKCRPAPPPIEGCPTIHIPGNFTYNGKSKTLGSHGTSIEQHRVPINIIDPKPDGGYKVTRIGTKSQDPED